MIRTTLHISYIFWLLALIFYLCNPAQADIALPGYQQLGDNDNDAVTYSQLQEYPFYVSLTSDITLTDISLENVSGLEDDSSLAFFINDTKVATGQPGAESAALNNPLSLSAGLHTLSLRGSCYDNGVLVSCSGGGFDADLSISDLDDIFVEPITITVNGDLNNPISGTTQQADGVLIEGNTNNSIDLLNGDNRLDIEGNTNDGDIYTGQQDDVVRIGGNNNVSIYLDNGDNQLQINGNHNTGTIYAGNQDDILKIKGSAFGSIDLSGGENKVEILQDFTSSLITENSDDLVYIHGNSSGTIDMGSGDNILKIGGNVDNNVTMDRGNDRILIGDNVSSSIDTGTGNDSLNIGGNFSGSINMENGNDNLTILGNASGNIDVGRGDDIVQIDGTISGSVDGGWGNDVLYVNMTEEKWNSSWQKDHVHNFENIIYSGSGSSDIIEYLDEDDFSFNNIILHTSPSEETTASIHFMQKRHLGDNDDTEGPWWWPWSGDGDGYGDIAEDSQPYYPDDAEGTSLSLQFTLAQPTSELIIDFYRLRALDGSNPVDIDGDPVGTLNGGDSVDLGADPYTLSIADNWGAGTHTLTINSESVSWNDNDDFSWDQIIITPTLVPEIDHYRIEHSATGITCQASTVTVRACANDNCSQEYDQEATITLSATSNGSNEATWIGGDTRTFTGSVDFLLQQTTEAIETIEVSNPSPVATNPTRYYEDGVEGDDTIQFYDTAIFIDGDSSDTEKNDSDIVTQIAGKPSNENPYAKTFQVKVLRTDDNTGACVPALIADGTAKFSYLVPEIAHGLTDNTFSVNSNGDSTSLFAANTPKDLDLIFDNNGVASFDLTSTDTGKYQLQVSMDILVTDENGNPLTDANGNPTNETYTVSDTTNTFIVRPLAVFVDAADNPQSQNANDGKFKTAAANFTLNFKALRWTTDRDSDSNGVWDACGQSELGEDSEYSVPDSDYARVPIWDIGQPAADLVLPAGGNNPGLSYSDGYVTFTAGESIVTADNVSYSEVGIIQMQQDGANNFPEESGVPVPLCSPYIGRFYPHHFELTQGDLTNRVERNCDPASNFTYLGENLEFTYTLTAKNAAEDPTKNYIGDFAKFNGTGAVPFGEQDSDYTVAAIDEESDTPLNNRLDLQSFSMVTPWDEGVAEFKVKLHVKRADPEDGPFDNAIFGVSVMDSDDVSIADFDLDADVDGTNEHIQAAPGTILRYGRISLENAHGSELLDLNVPMNAEYFKEGSFRKNTDDTCTEITPPLVIYDIQPALDSVFSSSDICVIDIGSPGNSGIGCELLGETAKQFSSPPDNGDFNLWFAAPGAGKTGSFMIEADVPDFLQYDWKGEGDDNPTARATFGIYKGNERIIYLRETTWR
jgi:MSHA biogenesis protein MshQ